MEAESRTIQTNDGRQLRLIEAGVPDGFPILIHHGTPGSRILYTPWIKDAEEHGIHLISYDRPGYGGSSTQTGRTVASAAADVAIIAKELNLSRLAVLGISGGGPHGLACAALLPDLVVAAAALASGAPYQADGLDWFAGMEEDNLTEFGAALKGRQALEQVVEAAATGILDSTPTALVQAVRPFLSPVEAAAFTQDFAGYLLDTFREGIHQSRDGWIDDDLAIVNAWGFDPSQIRIPVMLMHGAQDKVVPFAHGRWLVNKIPNINAQLLPEDGHLTLPAQRIPEVHAWLVSKM